MGVFDFIRDAGSRILKGNKDERIEAAREAAEQAKEKAAATAERAKERAESSGAADKARSAAAAAQKRAAEAAAQAKEKATAARDAAAEAQAKARAAFEERRAEARKADELEDYIKDLGLGDDIDVRFDDGTAYVSGTVADQAMLERIVLAVGNVEGVERVDEELEVEEPADAAQMYTVQPGDTLSAIAERFYGDASRYPEIFEANTPMLTDPDLIYPGQTLRIP